MFTQMKEAKKLVTIIPLLFLTACGGGGDTPDLVQLTPTPDDNYTGIQVPALLDQTNTVLFAEIVFGSSTDDTLLSRPADNQQSILKDQPAVLTYISSILKKQKIHSSVQARRVQESENCTFSGSVSYDAEVDDTTGTIGTVNYTFNHCEDENGAVLNGQGFSTVYSTDNPEHYIVGYDDLTFSEGGESFSLSGTIEYHLTSNAPIITTETINLSSTNTSGYSTYLKDFIFKAQHSGEDSIEGQIYIGDEGYITLSNSEGYYSRDEDGATPLLGDVYFSGAAQSIARARGTANNVLLQAGYWLDLDQAGDGYYEYYSLQDTTSDTIVDLTQNQPPVANFVIYRAYLAAENGDVIDEYVIHDETNFLEGTTLQFRADEYTDPDGDETTYSWAIESAPDGSNGTLEVDHLSEAEATLITDVTGNYRVSLTVSDPYGSQQGHSAVMDINVIVDPNL